MNDLLNNANLLELPPVGLSAASLGSARQSSAAGDDNESIAAIRRAVELGLRLIATSPSYAQGGSEALIGQSLHDMRDRVVLASKLAPATIAAHSESSQTPADPEDVIRACEASLRRLRTDRIDLYRVAPPAQTGRWAPMLGAIAILKERGLIRHLALCDVGIEQTLAACEHAAVECVEAPFSLLNRRASEDLIPFCKKRGIAFIASSPLAKGLLTGRIGPQTPLRDARAADPEFQGVRLRRNQCMIEALAELAISWEKSIVELALAWVCSYPGVSSALIGARRVSQIEVNAAAARWTLSDAQRGRIDEVLAAARTRDI